MMNLQIKLWSVKLQEVQDSEEIISIHIRIQKNSMRPPLHWLSITSQNYSNYQNHDHPKNPQKQHFLHLNRNPEISSPGCQKHQFDQPKTVTSIPFMKTPRTQIKKSQKY